MQHFTHRDNRYASFFLQMLDTRYHPERHGRASDFIADLLGKLEARLLSEGRSPEEVAGEMELAHAGASSVLQRQGRSEEHAGAIAEPASATAVPMAEASARPPSGPRRMVPIWLRTAILVLLAVTYTASNAVLLLEENGGPIPLSSAVDATMLTLDVGVVDFAHEKLTVHLTPKGGDLFGRDGHLNDDLKLVVEGGDGPMTHLFHANAPITPFTFTVEIDSGDILSYPFDQYAAALDIAAFSGERHVRFTAVLETFPHGLKMTLSDDASNPDDVGLQLLISRSPMQILVAFLLVGSVAMVALSASAVAWFVTMRGHKLEFSMLIWTAALLFVVPSVRNSLPGQPPQGAFVDTLVFFWLQALVAMANIGLVIRWIGSSEKDLPPLTQ